MAMGMKKLLPTRRDALNGTSLRVYRYVYGHGPVRLSDLQRGLKMSSSSVAEYHLKKLAAMGLVREGDNGYEADRVIFESMIRIRRTLIPLWATFAAFLATSLTCLLTLLRPSALMTPAYLLSLITISVSLVVSLYETLSTLKTRV